MAPDMGRLCEGALLETAHVFGDGLMGVLSRPQDGGAGRPGVILLNAGLVHRAGPFRGYVALARALANCGFNVLRFDQAGLGDSEAASGAMSGPERKRQDLDAAIGLLARECGVSAVVLAGICSGADDAFRAADADDRVAGIVLLDGVAYPTSKSRLKLYGPKLLDAGKLVRSVGKLFSPGSKERWLNEGDFRDFPSQEEATARFRRLVARDARALLLYTGGAARYFNYADQARDCFGPVMDAPQVTVEYWPDCDHTFYLRGDKLRLAVRLSAWLRTQFPAKA